MSFLDKIKQQAGVVAEAAGNVAQGAVKQTKTLASVGRIKLAISSEEDKMKKAYTELGRLFYRDYEAQAEADMADYQPWCDKVADARAQIDRLNEELEKVRAEDPEDEKAAEAPETAEADIQVDLRAEAPAEPAPEPEPPKEDPENVVDTLYVDVSNTEDA